MTIVPDEDMLDEALLVALREQGVDVDDGVLARLAAHVEGVRGWQVRASLVSTAALERLWRDHVTDCLTLTPHLGELYSAGYAWWDIGSGGGFPALTGKAVWPEMPLYCWERSVKKSDALRDIAGQMGLGSMEVLTEDFGRERVHMEQPVVYTARAVEKAVRVQRNISKSMRSGDVFLCQHLPEPKVFSGAMFHVEHIRDGLEREGWRRGTLHRITREG